MLNDQVFFSISSWFTEQLVSSNYKIYFLAFNAYLKTNWVGYRKGIEV